MAVRFGTVVQVVLLVVLVSVMEYCGSGNPGILVEAAPAKNQSRKLLHGAEEVFKKRFGSAYHEDGGNAVSWDLRTVPSGPDPLHHNGGGSKKPKTP